MSTSGEVPSSVPISKTFICPPIGHDDDATAINDQRRLDTSHQPDLVDMLQRRTFVIRLEDMQRTGLLSPILDQQDISQDNHRRNRNRTRRVSLIYDLPTRQIRGRDQIEARMLTDLVCKLAIRMNGGGDA